MVLYLTQLLPWTLVSRCTFLYHYFPSLWFAVAALALLAVWCHRRWPRPTKAACGALVGLAAVWFVCWYPAASGLAVPEGWIEALRWLPSWMF